MSAEGITGGCSIGTACEKNLSASALAVEAMEATLVEGVGDEVVAAFVGVFVLFLLILFQWAFSRPTSQTWSSDAPLANAEEPEGSIVPNTAEEPSQLQSEENEAEPEIIPVDTTEVQIRLKYLNDTERNVECTLSTKVGVFKDRFFPEERVAGKVIRLISCGKLLSDELLSLRHFGVAEANNVLHVQISNPPLTPAASVQQPAASNVSPAVSRLEANIASLAYLVLGAMLVLFWYVHFQYRDLFTNSATTALVGISGLFCVFVFAPSQPLPLYFHTVAQQLAPEM
ncbi:transmembrane and ubiquitin domain-containing protein 1-like [Tropilaelaps mercedesae]|uniref:Transmembrane and ubiquitin domain-containing protein 1-like n=1 Tax=Tropilaelaps mercedesae TaxID=418985 RepID=A0A1V9XE53_9ACAR|nr:transmembrane and ubiquitin domain-containing protein 1-like [Tropilaelaps mercedesae]